MGAFRIARVSGIDIRVHVSFLLIVLLGAMQWGGLGPRGALFGAVLTLLIFASVTLHELGHSLVAQAFGIPVKHITLYPIGGVAQLGKRPKSPGQEFLIALAGPAVNVVLALGLGSLGVSLFGAEALWEAVVNARVEQPTEVTLFAMLVSSNVVLAVFNMVPALPMDGGRVLRAVLSWLFGAERATQVSASIAQVLAAGLFVVGLLSNPMLSIIAAFIFFGAGQEVREQQLARVLDGVQAGDAVNPYAPRFMPNTTLGEAMQAVVFTPYAAFAVEHFGRLVGVVTRDALVKAANEQGAWGYVAGVMERQVPVIDAREPLETARFKMNEAERPYVAVERDGIFLGLVTEVELAQQALLAEQFGRSARAPRGGAFVTRS
jgi:Zn-dependent protease